MRQILFTFAVVLVFGLAALAQDTTPGSPQSGTQSTNPTTGTSSTSSSTGSGQYGGAAASQSSPSSGSMGQSSASDDQGSTKGEKKLKGCIESQGGQYVLQEKGGKQVELTGSADLASHVGHQVTVHGTYSGSSASA